MIPRIADAVAKENFQLFVTFDDGTSVQYDVLDDIHTIPAFKQLEASPSLFNLFSIDDSRTVITWNDQIDLPSDQIKEYGIPIK